MWPTRVSSFLISSRKEGSFAGNDRSFFEDSLSVFISCPLLISETILCRLHIYYTGIVRETTAKISRLFREGHDTLRSNVLSLKRRDDIAGARACISSLVHRTLCEEPTSGEYWCTCMYVCVRLIHVRERIQDVYKMSHLCRVGSWNLNLADHENQFKIKLIDRKNVLHKNKENKKRKKIILLI